MKYEGKRASGVDHDVEVYSFVFGIEELRALKMAIVFLHNSFPKVTETHVLRSRLGTMGKTLEKFSQEEKRSLKL